MTKIQDEERLVLASESKSDDLSSQITPSFQSTFKTTLRLQKALRIHSTIACIIFFPLGFLTLPAFTPNIRFSLSLSMNLLLSILAGFLPFLPVVLISRYGHGSNPMIMGLVFFICLVWSVVLFLFFLIGVILAGVGNHLERKLLRLNPNHFLFLLHRSLSAPTVLSPFEILCHRISVLGRQLRGFSIFFCIGWFPLGLLFLFGLKGKSKIDVRRMLILSSIGVVGHIVWLILFGTFGLESFIPFPLASLVLLGTFIALLFRYQAFERRALEEDRDTYISWMNSNQEPLFNAWNF